MHNHLDFMHLHDIAKINYILTYNNKRDQSDIYYVYYVNMNRIFNIFFSYFLNLTT